MKTILAAAAAILALAASAQAAPDWVQSSQQAQAAIQECQKHLTPYVSRGAVDGRISAITHPKTLSVSSDFTYCSESQVRLFCMNGSCGVFFNSKKYGYDPRMAEWNHKLPRSPVQCPSIQGRHIQRLFGAVITAA